VNLERVRELIARAREAETAGDLAAAAAAFDELVAIDSESAGAWSARGLFLERRRRFAEAAESFRRSTRIRPSYCDHYNAGNMLHALGNNNEAFVEYEAALACDPTQAQGWCNRGIALFKLGRSDEARTSFDRAIALDPKLVNAYHCKAVLLEQLGDPVTALREQLAELDPRPQRLVDLAVALGKGITKIIYWEPGGIEERIVDIVERALARDCPDPPRTWCWAEKLMRLQRIAHGRQSARRAGLNIDEQSAIARYLAAAETARTLYPEDPWFAEKLADARDLSSRT
jgi:tetratricopeptide (TPR) repeat protein